MHADPKRLTNIGWIDGAHQYANQNLSRFRLHYRMLCNFECLMVVAAFSRNLHGSLLGGRHRVIDQRCTTQSPRLAQSVLIQS